MRRNRLSPGAILILAAAIAGQGGLLVETARPCDDTVRGQAFVERRDVHRLCVVTTGQTPEDDALSLRLETWLAGAGRDLNLELVRLDARDQTVKWEDYGIPSAPPELPVVVLAGVDRANRRSFVIDHWAPPLTDQDLEALAGSPAREAIGREAATHWAVLLHAPGAGPTSASGIVESAARQWSEKHAPGVSVVRLDRADPRERLLAAFIGLPASGPDWVGVVFGRGKLMAPPLQGAEITGAALEGLLAQLVEMCSCLRPPSMMGVDVPMAWGPETEKAVVSLLPPAGVPAPAAGQREGLELPPAGRKLMTALSSALGLSVFIVLGATFFLIRREKSRR